MAERPERLVAGIVVHAAVLVALGAGLVSLAFAGPQTPLGRVGVAPMLTGALGGCPVDRVLGVDTCSLGKRASS